MYKNEHVKIMNSLKLSEKLLGTYYVISINFAD